jgi:hypothetical protein
MILRDGQYAVWFRTSRGEGTGIVHLANGEISGGDSFFSYSGVYEIDGDHFTATLTTKRRIAGAITLLGVDEVELKLTGKSNGTIACCSGTSEQAPGVHFEATVFFGQEQPPRPEPPRAVPGVKSELKLARLPSLDSGRYPTRTPFGPRPTR